MWIYFDIVNFCPMSFVYCSMQGLQNSFQFLSPPIPIKCLGGIFNHSWSSYCWQLALLETATFCGKYTHLDTKVTHSQKQYFSMHLVTFVSATFGLMYQNESNVNFWKSHLDTLNTYSIKMHLGCRNQIPKTNYQKYKCFGSSKGKYNLWSISHFKWASANQPLVWYPTFSNPCLEIIVSF